MPHVHLHVRKKQRNTTGWKLRKGHQRWARASSPWGRYAQPGALALCLSPAGQPRTCTCWGTVPEGSHPAPQPHLPDKGTPEKLKYPLPHKGLARRSQTLAHLHNCFWSGREQFSDTNPSQAAPAPGKEKEATLGTKRRRHRTPELLRSEERGPVWRVPRQKKRPNGKERGHLQVRRGLCGLWDLGKDYFPEGEKN